MSVESPDTAPEQSPDTAPEISSESIRETDAESSHSRTRAAPHSKEEKSAQQPPSKTKKTRWFMSVVVAFVLVGFWISVMIGIQLLRDRGPSFRGQVIEVFTAISNDDAEQLYDGASPKFRENMHRAQFYALVELMNNTLGPFREITAILETEHIKAPGGETGRVRVRIAFARGETVADVSFHYFDDRWRLLGVFVDIPEDLRFTAAKGTAPPEVMGQVVAIFEDCRDGKGARVYDQASPPFQQSVDLATFLELLEKRNRLLGDFVGVTSVIESQQDPETKNAHVVVLVNFTNVSTTANLSFIKDEDGKWRLLGFKVIIPKPKVDGVNGEGADPWEDSDQSGEPGPVFSPNDAGITTSGEPAKAEPPKPTVRPANNDSGNKANMPAPPTP